MLCTFLCRGSLTSAAARGGGGHCWWRQLARPANARAATARVLDDGSRTSPPPLESSESGQLHRTTSELAQKKQFLEGVGLRPRSEAAVLQARPSKDALVLNAVREMAPYLSVHAGATMVVHIPGGLVASESLGQFLDDVSLLHMLGISKRGQTVVLPITSRPLYRVASQGQNQGQKWDALYKLERWGGTTGLLSARHQAGAGRR